jgi:hypothetical protein
MDKYGVLQCAPLLTVCLYSCSDSDPQEDVLSTFVAAAHQGIVTLPGGSILLTDQAAPVGHPVAISYPYTRPRSTDLLRHSTERIQLRGISTADYWFPRVGTWAVSLVMLPEGRRSDRSRQFTFRCEVAILFNSQMQRQSAARGRTAAFHLVLVMSCGVWLQILHKLRKYTICNRLLNTYKHTYIQTYTNIRLYMHAPPVWWPAVKNSPNVAHVCRKRRLKWAPSAWGYSWATRAPEGI